ncbi:hypothetical protein [Flindersiella endophytica]
MSTTEHGPCAIPAVVDNLPGFDGDSAETVAAIVMFDDRMESIVDEAG